MGLPTLRVKNWRRFQHYVNRNPPWFKVHHRDLVQSRDWITAPNDMTRLAMIIAMMEATGTEEGTFQCDPELIKARHYLAKAPDFKPLIASGFLIVESDPEQLLADESTPVPKPKLDERAKYAAQVGRCFDIYDNLAAKYDLPKVQSRTKAREAAIRARINEHGFEKVIEMLDTIPESPYLLGQVNDFRATIDWIFGPKNFVKVHEGNYRDSKNKKAKKEKFSHQVGDHSRPLDNPLF